jgi:spore coat protein U-like protein
MQFQKSLLTATLLAAASLTAVSANAVGTATGNFDVTIKIDSTCIVSAVGAAQNINFGTVAAGDADDATSATDVTVACSKNAPYIINLTPSNNDGAGAGVMARLGSGSDTVPYQLRKETGAAGAIWGNGGNVVNGDMTPGNSLQGVGTGIGNVIPHTIFATVTTTATDVQPGDYKDIVAIEVIY